MTALEQLPARLERVESALGALSTRIDDTRHEMRVLHEDVLGRIAVVGEGVAANAAGLKAVDEKVARMDTRLSGAIDASRAEARAMFEQVFTRLDALVATRNRPRRSRKP